MLDTLSLQKKIFTYEANIKSQKSNAVEGHKI